jgi:hypothetical protein
VNVNNFDAALKQQLTTVVQASLAHAPGVEGALWQSNQGSLAYAFPTYEGTGPKTDVPEAELSTVERVNADALGNDRSGRCSSSAGRRCSWCMRARCWDHSRRSRLGR